MEDATCCGVPPPLRRACHRRANRSIQLFDGVFGSADFLLFAGSSSAEGGVGVEHPPGAADAGMVNSSSVLSMTRSFGIAGVFVDGEDKGPFADCCSSFTFTRQTNDGGGVLRPGTKGGSTVADADNVAVVVVDSISATFLQR